jgi:S-adenosylmethionine decarboxylase
MPATMQGEEWVIDALGCGSDLLADLPGVRALCERAVAELGLRVVDPPLWHVFPGAAGVTGLYLLSESHLTCHTWPEDGVATFNLFTCRALPSWPWRARLRAALEAERVVVRRLRRGHA